MKRNLLSAIAACAAINFASAQWTRLTSPTTNNLYAVAFNNERFGYAVGEKGTVLRTNDGGATWTVLPSPDSTDIKSVIIVDSATVIVATANSNGKSAIYKSITRGNSWHKMLRDDKPFNLEQLPNGNLFGMSTFAYLSTDKGETWQTGQRLNSTSSYNEVEFPDNHHGFIGGNVIGDTTNHAEFLRTEDVGQTWHQSYAFGFPNNFAFSSMSALNADTLFMFTNYDKRFHPKDSSQLLMLFKFKLRPAGNDTIWNFRSRLVNKSIADIMNTCKFFSGGLGYAAGDHGNIYISTTNGKKWTKEYRGRVTINSLYMLNENKGYAVGDNGLVLKRDVAVFSNVPAELLPMKVFPNPASSSSTVSFTLKKSAGIVLQVADEKGTIVYTDQSKKYNAGTYQRTIPVANFHRGVYHINVIIDGNLKGKSELLVVH
jgi:photosystem II stability/assembly factor-like uncharacterized protein